IMIKVYPYKNILENDVWTVLLRKCANPILNANSPISHAVLPQAPKRMKKQSPIDDELPLPSKIMKTQSPFDA
ncbi:8797_t:CDS:1, partial [Gigaspora margarita]